MKLSLEISKIFVTASLITTFSLNAFCQKTDSVLSKVEIEASFPGGTQAWTKYVTDAILENQGKLKKSDYGTCIVKFIVDTEGNVSDVQATTMKKSRLAKIAVKAIANGPRWTPAQQNGRFVNAYRLQPVTLSDPDK
jgi:protein TonB